MPATSEPLRSFCIVADDLSGAADCAASFARVTGPVPVFLGERLGEGSRVAIDTDTRTMEEAAAAAATARVFAPLAAGAHQLVYKKIDSTLRGHVGAELAAALAAAPAFAAAVVAPSFPQQGRTLAGGRLLVHGRAAGARGADLCELLAQAGLRPALIAPPFPDPASLRAALLAAVQGGARAVAVDAAGDEELAAVAAALLVPGAPRLLAVGSAGLARAFAAHAPAQPAAAPAPAGPVLTVVGSFSPASAAQVEQVERAGAAQVLRLGASQWQGEADAALRREIVAHASAALEGGRHVLFAAAGEVVQPFSRRLVEAIARATACLVPRAAACVLTGGDTARAMLEQLGIARLDVAGEVEPGISIGAAGTGPAFILKAGGFGDAGALLRVIRRFGRAPGAARPD